ncbi:dihydroxyacetone kinase subunit DhaL [Clostridium luticellarii]|jgi:dihydroxyacetone kinase-like protein|uniref:phosphoenolpyruvate--glycerone phosphotransferase n=1 Tax=Clostridium luticellarii TaxID=1691940 RepID=A0A2T0BA87_9CLOT|nr:dihydroxyacetone kinase subunit DhaL [Clostridium luticellarii]MCI1944253.1 dihydroxyacetone kinase subunit L [Clostridium luticellarii]MCI1967749.1 dihydroxyacetone kinase subunit L [Clostridium luticellarii]MCI1994627.1 dihydroxyacetone kinase subunit L [Clostridium luticellarii]MCI2038876.1 dihydroxyacetone kinase subunit L [Clostridium luticellarii]PRR80816.1 PTS-dependent dihydroxyacetone kinase, ADP-binding subunit DhaL [Clostridium luticellarii]
MGVDGKQVKKMITSIAAVIGENKDYLTKLDAAIGDGDHGLNLDRGFSAVREKLKYEDEGNIGSMLKDVGMTLISKVGGASGPLYGTAFMKASVSVKDKSTVDINDFFMMLKEALAGIKMRGKAQRGDKTMVDSIEPAVDSLKNSLDKKLSSVEALKRARDEAFRGMNDTKNISARKGRASYLGKRSIGHQDPGATSSYIILNTIYEEVKRLTSN